MHRPTLRLGHGIAAAAVALSLPFALNSPAAHAQAATGVAFTPFYSFGTPISDGAIPLGGLIVGANGSFYGMTSSGGYDGDGTVYSITTSGTETILHDFTGNDGDDSYGQLILGANGNYYGTTNEGGSGTVGLNFEITPAGAITTLVTYQFSGGGYEGDYPRSGLILGADGDYYGTLTYNSAGEAAGYVYKMAPDGTFTSLHTFGGPPYDGEYPYGPLVLGTDGNFYGTTGRGGTDRQGTVFTMTPSGTLTTLHSFAGAADGSYAFAGLVEGLNGNYYGLAYAGGANGTGTAFRVTPSGTFTLLHTFGADVGNTNSDNTNGDNNGLGSGSGNADGAYPIESLILGTDGNFYGATEYGGANDTGTVFQLTPSGQLTTLYTFSADSGSGNTDGAMPHGTLLEASDGTLYGTTCNGGANEKGSIYTLAVSSLTSSLSSLSLNDTSADGGAEVTGTVTISAPASAGGITVALSSNASSATVPANVTIPAGATSAAFTVDTTNVSSTTTATITAAFNNGGKTAMLTINPATASPPTLSSVTLAASSVAGGMSLTGNRVILTGSATADTTVHLSSSNTAVATVPSEEVVLAGSASHSFTITTTAITTAQTVTITATSGGVTKTATLTVTPAAMISAATRFDFNKDNHADLFWYNTVSGGVSVWDMDDQSVLSYGGTFAALAPSSGWVPVATPDINDDGYPDLLWWNKNTGEMSFWALQNTDVTQFYSDFATVQDTDWKPVAAADVTGTTWELVFENSATGAISAWRMNGQTVVSYGATLAAFGADNPWQVVGAPDIDGDGHSDLLFWNDATGEVSYWSCDLAASTPQVLAYHGDITTLDDTSWRLVGSEDTNGDGKADLLWWNASTGEVSRWLLNGASVAQYGGETTDVTDTTWQPTAIR